jgi:hypothetical protein
MFMVVRMSAWHNLLNFHVDSETEDGIAITAENELDEAVAESADAIINNYRMGH